MACTRRGGVASSLWKAPTGGPAGGGAGPAGAQHGSRQRQGPPRPLASSMYSFCISKGHASGSYWQS